MILVLCQSADCGTVTRVMGEPHEVMTLVGQNSEWWPNKYSCPRCNATAHGELEHLVNPSELGARHVIELEAQEMFLCLQGMGLPEERDCRSEVVVAALKASSVKKVKCYGVQGTWRTILEWLELENGTKLYFGSSAHGAAIYRIVLPTKHAAQLLEEP